MSSFCPNNLSEMTTCFDSKSSCSITVNRVLSCKIFDLLSPPIFGIKIAVAAFEVDLTFKEEDEVFLVRCCRRLSRLSRLSV